ncbi:DMT family transporter [Streptomyces sp. H51]|uniref:DMT family transporter n=1 Tax=Streptomyces sp. H51 TaxID=3111770 RepID=UPI002D783AA1|nr:DMT family transporter [Streptomyces sp. H51]
MRSSGPGSSVRRPATAHDRTVVILLTLATAALLTAGWVLSGVLVADDVPPLAVATGRAAGSTLVLVGIALTAAPARAAFAQTARRGRAVLVLAFLGYFVYFVGTMLGVQRMGASKTGLVVALLPCVTLAIGAAAFGERVTWRKAVGTVVAVAGAFGYTLDMSGAGSHTTDLLIGGAWTLLATVTFALYNYLYRKDLHDVSPLGALPVVFAVATVMLAPVAAVTEPLSDVTARQWLGTLALGALLTAPVYVTAHELVLRRGPLYMAAVSLFVPFLVRVTEWSLGNAPAMDAVAVVTMVVCLTGIAITVRPGVTEPTQHTDPATGSNGRKHEHTAGHADQPEQDPSAHHPLRPGHPDDIA